MSEGGCVEEHLLISSGGWDVPCVSETDGLLNRDLKGRWGYTGYVMSDWWAIHSAGYQFGGLDMDMPGNDHYFKKENLIQDPGPIDDMVTRTLAAYATPGVEWGRYLVTRVSGRLQQSCRG